MKKYLKNIKDKEFLIPMLYMLGGQFITYMILKHFQYNYHVFNNYIDNKIPFIPQVIILYNLFYPMIFIVFYNIYRKDKETFNKGIIAGIIGFVIADIIFLLYPVEIIRPDISDLNIDHINKYIIYLTYKYDSPAINCFPSLHCIFCFNAIYTLYKSNNYKLSNKIIYIIILLMIATTTLLVKQHYIYDVICAFIVTIISILLSNVIYKYKK